MRRQTVPAFATRLFLASRITKPLFVVQGRNDPRVQDFQFYATVAFTMAHLLD